MAIAKVQSVTGNGATLVLNGVAAGNALFLQMSCLRVGGTSAAPATPTDSNGTFAVSSADAMISIGSDFVGAAIWHEQNAAAGTHTVTPATGLSYNCTLTEFSGLATASLLDQPKSAGTANFAGTSQVTGTTAATAQADELSLTALCLGALSGVANVGLTDPIVNYTTLQILQNDAVGLAMHHSFRVLTAAGTQSATENWTDTETGQSSMACIATFKGAASVVADSVTYPQRGGRGPGRGPAMRRMAPQQFQTLGSVDAITPAQQIQPLRSRGPGMGPRLRRMVPQRLQDASTSTTTTLLPTEGSITIAGVAASLTLTIAAVAGAITIAGNAPSVTTILQGVQGSIVIAGNAASTTSILAPTVGAVVISGSAPALTQTLVGVTGAVTIGGNAPSQTNILAATEGALVIGGSAPSLVVSSGLSPTEGVISISGNAPDLASALAVTDGAITIAGNAPSIIGAGSTVEQASNWQSGHQWRSRTKKELKDEEDRQRIELGILPPELQAVAEQAVSDAVSASTELAAGRVEPQNAIAVAMQAREEYDSAYKQAYKGAYIAEVVAELWKEDVKRAQRRRAVALLLLH